MFYPEGIPDFKSFSLQTLVFFPGTVRPLTFVPTHNHCGKAEEKLESKWPAVSSLPSSLSSPGLLQGLLSRLLRPGFYVQLDSHTSSSASGSRVHPPSPRTPARSFHCDKEALPLSKSIYFVVSLRLRPLKRHCLFSTQHLCPGLGSVIPAKASPFPAESQPGHMPSSGSLTS